MIIFLCYVESLRAILESVIIIQIFQVYCKILNYQFYYKWKIWIFTMKSKVIRIARLHSLNAFWWNNTFHEKFKDYCNKYDNIIKGINTINHDSLSEGRNIIKLYFKDILSNKYTDAYSINSYKKSRNEINIGHYNN